MNAQQLHDAIPWDRLREAWPDGSNPLSKYPHRDTFQHCQDIVDRCRLLGLIDAPPCRVLDIGCAIGTMVECCRLLGHEAVGLDSDTWYSHDIDGICGGPRIFWSVTTEAYLPRDLPKFDVVCIARVNLFMQEELHHKRLHWHAFLRELARTTGCRKIFVSMNRGERPVALLQGIDWFSEAWVGDDVVLEPLMATVPSASANP